MHYARWKRSGSVGGSAPTRGARLSRRCSIDGCDRAYKAKGFCNMHWNRVRTGLPVGGADTLRVRNVCTVGDCVNLVHTHRYCAMHYARFRTHGTTDDPRPTEDERFWGYIDKTDACWNWTGTQNGRGYGFFAPHRSGYVQVHRYSYEKLIGPIPEGLTIDHLCRNKLCVNPEHLEPVTAGENTRRAQIAHGIGVAVTHCPQGHEYTVENTYVEPKGSRSCRTCRVERTRIWRAEKAAGIR